MKELEELTTAKQLRDMLEKDLSRYVNAKCVVKYIDLQEAKKKKLAEGLVKVEKSLKNGQLISAQGALDHLVYLLQEYSK